MTTLTCADCTTPYSTDLQRCPHCSSERYMEDSVSVRRLPPYLRISCATDGCVLAGKERMLRLNSPQLGLVELPSLYCSACGGQVSIPWPPEEEHMPKISRHKGATNARESAAPSPDAPASLPPVVAEDGRGHPTHDPQYTSGLREAVPAEPPPEVPAEAYGEGAVELDAVPAPDYDGMTLAELREEAGRRDVAAYGTKAQIAERLRADDEE